MKCNQKGCLHKAKFFGKFLGGVCLEHAAKLAQEYGVQEFHPEYQEILIAKIEKDKSNGNG